MDLPSIQKEKRDLRPKLFDKLCYFVESECVDYI